jgi:hypothetical protein
MASSDFFWRKKNGEWVRRKEKGERKKEKGGWRMSKKKRTEKNQEKNERERDGETHTVVGGVRKCFFFFLRFDAVDEVAS